jgi:hypothetical protein
MCQVAHNDDRKNHNLIKEVNTMPSGNSDRLPVVVERVEFVCPACGDKLIAVAHDGIVTGLCAKTGKVILTKI